MHWTEHPGAGAVLGAANSSVIGTSLAGCMRIQSLFMGNASFNMIYSLQGFGLVSLSGRLKGDRALLGSCLPGAPLNPPRTDGEQEMRSTMNRNSVDEREWSVSSCGSPSSGAEEGRTPGHRQGHRKDSGTTPQHDTGPLPRDCEETGTNSALPPSPVRER